MTSLRIVVRFALRKIRCSLLAARTVCRCVLRFTSTRRIFPTYHQNDHLSGRITDISVMWRTSCKRGRDSATRECFRRGFWGTIFVRSSKLSLFFPELCSFRRVFFVSHAFERFGDKRSSSVAFGFDDVLEVFLKTPFCHRAFIANSDYDQKYFLKFPFFSKAEPVLLSWQRWRSPGWAKHFGDGTSKTRMKTWLPGVGEIERRRTIDRRRYRYESCAVIHGPKGKEKTHGSQRELCEALTLHHLQTSEFWGAYFRYPMSLPFYTTLLSCTWMYSGRTVRLQRGENEKSSHPRHFGCWSLRPNGLEWTDLVNWTGALHRFITWCN